MKYGVRGRREWRRKVCRRKLRRVFKRSRLSGCFRSKRLSAVVVIGKRRRVNKHHMTNKRYGGGYGKWNILWLEIHRHKNLHDYFKNLRWEAIADMLYYGTMMERREFRRLSSAEVGDALFSIFRKRDPMACVRLMDRVSRAKGRIAREVRREAA